MRERGRGRGGGNGEAKQRKGNDIVSPYSNPPCTMSAVV